MPWSLIFPFLQNLLGRVLPDPQQKLDAQKQLAELDLMVREAEAKAEAARADEFARFIEATQPRADNLYRWANTVIALVRPALAVFTAYTLIYYTQRWLEILNVLKGAGIWGAIGISPLLVWVLGRDGLRMVLGVVGAIRNGGTIPNGAMPPGIPDDGVVPPPVRPAGLPRPAAPFTSKTGFKPAPPTDGASPNA